MTFFANVFRLIIPIGFWLLSRVLQRHQDRHPPEISDNYISQSRRMGRLGLRIFLPLMTPLLLFAWIYEEHLLKGFYVILLGSSLFAVLIFAFLAYLEFQGMKLLAAVFGAMTVVVFLSGLVVPPLRVPLPSDSDSSPIRSGFLGPEEDEPFELVRLVDLALIPPLILATAPVALMIGLLYMWAPKILPLSEKDQRTQRRKAIQLVLSLFTGFPKKVVGVENGKLKTYIKGNAFHGSGPGLVITEPENLVALRSGSQIQRLVGPGTVFTRRAEDPFAVVDLMKQFRAQKVKALTRDGIAVRAPCSSIFRISWGGKSPTLNHPWPHRKSAAYLAFFGGMEVNPEDKDFLTEHKPNPWKELPLRTAAQRLKRVIGKYSLDELYGSLGSGGGELPRQQLTAEVRSFTAARMKDYGIEIVGGSVGNRIEPTSEEVKKQHVDAWKARWARQILTSESKIDAEYLRQLGRVRASVLNEMLHDLIDQAKIQQRMDGDLTLSFLELNFLQMLEDIARDPTVEPLLPEATQAALKRRRISRKREVEDREERERR